MIHVTAYARSSWCYSVLFKGKLVKRKALAINLIGGHYSIMSLKVNREEGNFHWLFLDVLTIYKFIIKGCKEALFHVKLVISYPPFRLTVAQKQWNDFQQTWQPTLGNRYNWAKVSSWTMKVINIVKHLDTCMHNINIKIRASLASENRHWSVKSQALIAYLTHSRQQHDRD